MNIGRLLASILCTSIGAVAQSSMSMNGRSVVNYQITDLGRGSAIAINDSGVVTGYTVTSRGFIVSPHGSMQEIGTLGGNDSFPNAITAAGRVVGMSSTEGAGVYHAFLYDGRSMLDLGTLGGKSSAGLAVNSSGSVTGGSEFTLANGYAHAFLYSGRGSLQDLGTLGGPQSVGVAINNRGDVTGNSDVSTSPAIMHAFLYRNGVMQDLGGGEYSEARAINQSGWVTGSANRHPFLYRGDGPLVDLGTLGGDGGIGVVISDSGLVSGSADTANREFHAFLYSGSGPLQDLGTLGGGYSWPRAVNNAGQVVGVSAVQGSTVYHSFLFNAGIMYDLSAFAPGWDMLDVVSINNRSEIVGTGIIGGEYHAFRLDPVHR